MESLKKLDLIAEIGTASALTFGVGGASYEIQVQNKYYPTSNGGGNPNPQRP